MALVDPTGPVPAGPGHSHGPFGFAATPAAPGAGAAGVNSASAAGQGQVTQVIPIPSSVLRQANRRAVHLLPSLQRQFGGIPLPLRGHHYDALATLVAKLDTENSPVKLAATSFLNELVDADDAQVTAEREAQARAERERVTSPTRRVMSPASRVMSPVERVLSPTSPRSSRRSSDSHRRSIDRGVRAETPSGIPGPRLTTPTFGQSTTPVTARYTRPSPLSSGHARTPSTASTHSRQLSGSHSALPQLKPVPLTKRRPSSDPPKPLQEMQPNAPLTPQRGAPPRRKVGAAHAAYARLIEEQEKTAQAQRAFTPTRIQRPASVAYPASYNSPSQIPTGIPTRPASTLGSHAFTPTPQREHKRETPTPSPAPPARPLFEPTSSTSSAASNASIVSTASASSGSSGHSRRRSGLAVIGETVPDRWAHWPDAETHLLLPERPTAASQARMMELGAILSHFEVMRARMEAYRDELDSVRAQLKPAINSLSSSGSGSGSGSSYGTATGGTTPAYETPPMYPPPSTGRGSRAGSRRASMDYDAEHGYGFPTPTRASVSAGAGRERTWI